MKDERRFVRGHVRTYLSTYTLKANHLFDRSETRISRWRQICESESVMIHIYLSGMSYGA